jgi:hypothetical protein
VGFLRHDATVRSPLAFLEQNPAYGTALTFIYGVYERRWGALTLERVMNLR